MDAGNISQGPAANTSLAGWQIRTNRQRMYVIGDEEDDANSAGDLINEGSSSCKNKSKSECQSEGDEDMSGVLGGGGTGGPDSDSDISLWDAHTTKRGRHERYTDVDSAARDSGSGRVLNRAAEGDDRSPLIPHALRRGNQCEVVNILDDIDEDEDPDVQRLLRESALEYNQQQDSCISSQEKIKLENMLSSFFSPYECDMKCESCDAAPPRMLVGIGIRIISAFRCLLKLFDFHVVPLFPFYS